MRQSRALGISGLNTWVVMNFILQMTTSAYVCIIGHLSRYRMTVENGKDWEVWRSKARSWYNKASNRSPQLGHLYHDLAIVTSPFTLEQLSLYTKSLTCVAPYGLAGKTVMTLLFDPVLHYKNTLSFNIIFIKAHGILFTSRSTREFNAMIKALRADDLLITYINKCGTRFKPEGVYAAMSNIAALFKYGRPNEEGSRPPLRVAHEDPRWQRKEAFKASPANASNVVNIQPCTQTSQLKVNNFTEHPVENAFDIFSQSSRLSSYTLEICLGFPKNRNVYPLVHVYLVFLSSLLSVQQASKSFERVSIWRIIGKDMP